MAKVTSSSNRSKRSTNKPVTKGQNPQRANRQAVSQAKVTSAEARKPSPRSAGINKGKGAGLGRVTGTLGRPKPATPAKVTTGLGSKLTKAASAGRALAGVAKIAGPVGAAAAVMAPRKLADGTLKGKPTGNPQGPNVPKRLTQAGMDKGSFGAAFKASRSAGKKEFTWRGKKYNTKIKGEK